MSSSTVRRVHTAPTCPECGKHFVYTVDNPYTEVITRMAPGVVADEYVCRQFRAPEVKGKFYNSFTYKKVVGKSGRAWLVPDPEYRGMAGNIYVTDSEDWDKRGEGFGGSTLAFPILDPEAVGGVGVFDLKGGWHTSASALLEDMEIDLQKRHVTFVVVSRRVERLEEREDEVGRRILSNVMYDVLYMDPSEGGEGYFQRGLHIAEEICKTEGAVFLYKASDGGSMFGRHQLGDLRDPEDMW